MNKLIIAASRIAIIIFIIYGLGCAGLYMFPGSLIYFPQPRIGLPDEKVLKLPISEGDVLVTTRPRSGKNAIVYFGGNAENVSLNFADFQQVNE